MASEIIVLERNGQQQSFGFYYAIPAGIRIEIGGESTTGQYPVMTPSDSVNSAIPLVLTQAEKDALDAGEALLLEKSYALDPATPEAQLLAYAREMYTIEQVQALAVYQSRYNRIGQRFDKE